MSSRIFAIATAATMALTGVVIGANPAAADAPRPRPATATVPAHASTSVASSTPVSTTALLGELAAAKLTPAQAVSKAVSEASANGISTHISVTSRSTGAVLAQSGNAGTQVASESVVKLMIASYYLVLVGGYKNQSSSVLSQLSYMIRYSDDATANAYFTSSAVPTMAARYGLHSTINATDRVGHWGAVRITAHDMTTFLYKAAHDPEVGPWLLPVMAQVAPNGSDGFNQAFGMNSLSGTHGSKQGWGDDEFWSAANNVINSVGYTDKYYVAILQNSYSYPDPARSTATYAARTIQASIVGAKSTPPAPPKNGDFVRSSVATGIYRIAGGAPILVTSWNGFGGPKAVRTITAAQWRALKTVPVDGTFLRSTDGPIFRIAGGAPIYVSSWASVGGAKPTVTVDASAIARAGQTVALSHLKYYPVNGTFLRTTGGTFEVVSGAPTYIGGWSRFGGAKATVTVDVAAVTRAGQTGVWAHLRNVIPNGTFVTDNGNNNVYRMAGGAPIYVPSWSIYGGRKATQAVDSAAIAHAGGSGAYAHIRSIPSNGTYLQGLPGGKAYQIRAGRVVQIGHNTTSSVQVSQQTIDRAGGAAPYNHLR